MAALTVKKDVRVQPGKIFPYPVLASTKILEGALVSLVGGYATNGADTASHTFVGVADETIDNSAGASGAVNVKVRTEGVIDVAAGFTAAQTDLGAQAYISDNQTVVKTSTNSIKCGKIVAFVTTGKVRVRLQPLI